MRNSERTKYLVVLTTASNTGLKRSKYNLLKNAKAVLNILMVRELESDISLHRPLFSARLRAPDVCVCACVGGGFIV